MLAEHLTLFGLGSGSGFGTTRARPQTGSLPPQDAARLFECSKNNREIETTSRISSLFKAFGPIIFVWAPESGVLRGCCGYFGGHCTGFPSSSIARDLVPGGRTLSDLRNSITEP